MHTPASTPLIAALLLGIALQASAGPLQKWRESRQETQQAQEESLTAQATEARGMRSLLDQPYGADPRQRMDVYLPEHASGAPIIVMVHGGAWKTGDKRSRSVVENKRNRWVPRGVIFVSVNYRLLPEAGPLIQAQDVALALASVQAQAKAWGGEPDHIVLMGHSAGAHLAALLAADPRRARPALPWRGTVLLDSAALDVPVLMGRRHMPFYDEAFGADPHAWQAASPIHALKPGAAPLLLVCSTVRKDQPCAQAESFAHRAAVLGVRAELLPEAQSHRDINETLGEPGPYTDQVEAFMSSLDERLAARLAVPTRP